MHGEMLTYGLKEGTIDELLFIDDAPNGKECGCVCPNCKHKLVAKNGGKGGPRSKTHHFAHANGSEECGKGRMTALHILAQKILEKRKTLLLPEYHKQFVHEEAQSKTFDNVTLEEFNKVEDVVLRPDCVCRKSDSSEPLWVEIYCRHKVDYEKSEEIKKRQKYCVEIDFRDLLDIDYRDSHVVERLECDNSHKEWICCPAWDKKELEYQNAEAEKEQKRLQELQAQQKERERLQSIADTWFSYPDITTTQNIIYELKRKPFSSNEEEDCCIFDYLVPNGNWIGFIEKLPRNNEGRQVFYSLLRYYYNINLYDESRTKLWRLDKPMWELLQNQDHSQRESVTLECMIVIWVLNELQTDKHFRDKDSQLGKTFVKNKSIREHVINLIKTGRTRSYFDDEKIRMQIKEDLKGVPDGDVILHILNVCFPILPTKQKNVNNDSSIPTSTKDAMTTSASGAPHETEEDRNIRKYWEYVQKQPPSDKYIQQHSKYK